MTDNIPREHIPRHEYLRRRRYPVKMTGKEWASWWDFPWEFEGFAWVEIGGKEIWDDTTPPALD